jgi:ketosteroid isomerase-like protein
MRTAHAWTLAAIGVGVGLVVGVVADWPLLRRGGVLETHAETDPADPEIRQLVELQERMAAALAPMDSVALDSLIADDYKGINAGDQSLDKAVAAAILRSASNTLVHVGDDSIQVRRYGDVAIMTLRETVTARAGDSTATGRLRITAIWFKRDGSWRAVGSHATVIANPAA